MTYRYRILSCLFFITAAFAGYSCRKPYNPPVISAPNSYLVIEGRIIDGADSTIIRLSRTVKLSSANTANPERNATVTVESDQNTSYPLAEIRPGIYAVPALNLDPSHKYRLAITTAGGKQYASDYVPVVDSPPIDSLSYDSNGGAVSGPGMNVYISTHDASNKVQYFRWDYIETWEFTSAFQSIFYSNGDTVLPRNLQTDDIYHCWHSDTSSSVLLYNTARLSQSLIVNRPLAFVNSTSEKISVEYSILVRQYALTSDAYNFYVALKKNTEQLGSIFDAQPSELKGNIHCISNPNEPVIGYMSAGAITSKRIFVRVSQLPVWTPVTYYNTNSCTIATDPQDPRASCCVYKFVDRLGRLENQVDDYINYNIGHSFDPFIPISAIGHPGKPPDGYTASTKDCVDCTLRGTNVKPSFWQ